MTPPPRVVKASSIENSLFLLFKLTSFLSMLHRAAYIYINIYENAFKQPILCFSLFVARVRSMSIIGTDCR